MSKALTSNAFLYRNEVKRKLQIYGLYICFSIVFIVYFFIVTNRCRSALTVPFIAPYPCTRLRRPHIRFTEPRFEQRSPSLILEFLQPLACSKLSYTVGNIDFGQRKERTHNLSIVMCVLCLSANYSCHSRTYNTIFHVIMKVIGSSVFVTSLFILFQGTNKTFRCSNITEENFSSVGLWSLMPS